jgi:hypothetical protein
MARYTPQPPRRAPTSLTPLAAPPPPPPAPLAELKRVQEKAPNPADPAAVTLGPYVRRVESLRKRLDAVSYTMTRVQVRLESLQEAVTRHEAAAARARQAARAAAAAAAAAAVTAS